jgi:hypothetical protein
MDLDDGFVSVDHDSLIARVRVWSCVSVFLQWLDGFLLQRKG